MKHRTALLVAVSVAACTYKEYNTYEAPRLTDPTDSGVATPNRGQGGASGSGQGGDAGRGGDAGSIAAGGGAGDTSDASECTGCARIAVLSNQNAEYRLELEPARNLSNTTVLARIRVRDFVGDVYVSGFVRSGDRPENEVQFGSSSFNATSGWQTLGIDLREVQAFQAPAFIDAGGIGGFAGGGFDSGFPFDKRRVESIGLHITPQAGSGIFTPATVELDGLTFSNEPELDVDFSVDAGGFELVAPESATVTVVPGASSESAGEPSDVPAEAELGTASTGAGNFADCQNLVEPARARVMEAARSVPQCRTDADCRVYQTADLMICWDSCDRNWRGGAEHEKAVRTAIASERVQTTCGKFRELGCHPVPLSCVAPPSEPIVGYACVAQACEEVYE